MGHRPPVTANVMVLAPLGGLFAAAAAGCATGAPSGPSTDQGTEPGDVNGEPITAAHLRELLEQLDALCPGGLQAAPGGCLNIGLTDPVTGALRATVSRAELERLARRGCPQHPPAAATGRAAGGTATGAAAASDAAAGGAEEVAAPPGGCSCPVLGRPPAVDRYQPTPAQYRFVKARDRGCRHPGCGAPVGRVDLDHVRRYPDGPTDCINLCCLCRGHHRLKTHATGWRFTKTPDGVLSVTTPSGVTRSTGPPGLRLLAPPAPTAPPPPPEDPPPF